MIDSVACYEILIVAWLPLVTSYLGIDPSLEGTGLCLVTQTGAAVRMETVSTGLRDAARLCAIKDRTELFIPADAVFAAIEGYAYHEVGRVFELGEIGGVVRVIVHERNIKYVVVSPTSLKKFATGFAHADKALMIAAAVEAGANPADDNQADAFHLARVAAAFVGEMPLTRRSQMEVIHQLQNPTAKKPARRARRLVKNAV